MGPVPGGNSNSVAAVGGGANSGEAPRAFNPYSHLDAYGQSTSDSGFEARGSSRAPQPLSYAMHTAPLPHVSNLHPHHLSSHAFFLSPTQREELARRNDAVHAAAVPPEQGGPHLPEELHVYHSLVPLEAAHGSALPPALTDPRVAPPTAPGASLHLSGAAGEPSRVFGYRSTAYKALCTLDGKAYVLRRLEGFRLQHEAAIGLVERWRRIRHPSIVSVREAFTTRAFGDQCEFAPPSHLSLPRRCKSLFLPPDRSRLPASQPSSSCTTTIRSRRRCTASIWFPSLLNSTGALGVCKPCR
jgi:PAB-dependent poly(A)-specific ribonuclease subunit 3